jgi:ribosomal protein S18 acetylase RimI-like enzyme
MTAAEYEQATLHREAESVRALAKAMSEDEALDRVRQGTARFLPQGLQTPGHHLVVAENDRGEVVGDAWLGPDPSGAAGSAFLYDINVYEAFRRQGYGSAVLAAVEELAGGGRLRLNVNGDNAAAIALYRRSGYEVSSMVMSKDLNG